MRANARPFKRDLKPYIAVFSALVMIGIAVQDASAAGNNVHVTHSSGVVVLLVGGGADGADGIDGADGTNGTNGTNGIDGIDGAKGDDGKQGKRGKRGKQGKAGTQGTQGADGVNGTDGSNGSTGVSGVDGVAGSDGSAGEAGVAGLNGISGLSLTAALNSFDVAGVGVGVSGNSTGYEVSIGIGTTFSTQGHMIMGVTHEVNTDRTIGTVGLGWSF